MYASVIKHPLIAQPVIPESNFWLRVMNAEFTFSDYVELYDPVAEVIRQNPHMITLDASPQNVFLWNDTIHRKRPPPKNPHFIARALRALHPDTKIIIMLQKPVTWLYSLYHHVRGPSANPKSFHSCIVEQIKKFITCLAQDRSTTRSCSFVQMKTQACDLQHSIYYVYIEEWLKVFPRKQILVVRTEDYYSNRSAVMAEVFDFLELPVYDEEDIEDIHTNGMERNEHSKEQEMMGTTIELLHRFTNPYNEILAEILGDKKFTWTD